MRIEAQTNLVHCVCCGHWEFLCGTIALDTLLQDAMKGEPEKLLYVPCIIPDQKSRPDYLATVDCDPSSENYGKVCFQIHSDNSLNRGRNLW